MNDCLFTFRSVTGAQRAARVLTNVGINAPMMRTPRALSENGCGYCLRIRDIHCVTAAELMRNAGTPFSRAYRGDTMEEVAL